jgi:hypothetical protein
MTDEYRRVLHEWARSHMPAELHDRPIVDVEVRTSPEARWSEHTIEDAELSVSVIYLDEHGNRSEKYLADINLDNGGVTLTKLLHELFALAAREDQSRG